MLRLMTARKLGLSATTIVREEETKLKPEIGLPRERREPDA